MSVVVGYVPDATGVLAIRTAAQEARWRGTEVVVVNVVGASGYTTPTAADEKNLDSIDELLAREGVQHTIRTFGSESGVRPPEAILEVAEETSAELIVVGIKRRSAVAKAVLGSTAQRVLTGADCPVLSVRADDE
jgi:nucleotide-binding universal stress UspA family protein